MSRFLKKIWRASCRPSAKRSIYGNWSMWCSLSMIKPRSSGAAPAGEKRIDQGWPLIAGLVDGSLKGQPYSMTGPQLTQAIVGKFSTVWICRAIFCSTA